jgi:hypothetical protein
MLQMVSRLLPEVPLILVTAVATHLVMSFAQTLMHYQSARCPLYPPIADIHRRGWHVRFVPKAVISQISLLDL